MSQMFGYIFLLETQEMQNESGPKRWANNYLQRVLTKTINALQVWFERCRPSEVTRLGGFSPLGKGVARAELILLHSSCWFQLFFPLWAAMACLPETLRDAKGSSLFWGMEHQNSETWNNSSFAHSFDLMLPWWFHVVSVLYETFCNKNGQIPKVLQHRGRFLNIGISSGKRKNSRNF